MKRYIIYFYLTQNNTIITISVSAENETAAKIECLKTIHDCLGLKTEYKNKRICVYKEKKGLIMYSERIKVER